MFGGLLQVDPAWAGKVQFYELLFGTWTVYVFLVLLFEKALRHPLSEWKYAMITFLGAGAFWINHYFQKAPFWLTALNVYTVAFLVAWWWLGVRGASRSLGWKIAAMLGAIAFTIAFIGFEQISRAGVERWGMHEFCWMTLSFFGFVWLIWWRGRARAAAPVG
jgi:hypothetical protein